MSSWGYRLFWVELLLFGCLIKCLNANTVDDLTFSPDTTEYLFSNDTLSQSITIIHVKNQIQYFYQIKNNKRELNYTLIGNATKIESENMQFGEVNDSIYTVDIYEDKKGDCWIIIAIDNENEELLTIDETPQCKEYKNSLIPVNSLDILHLVKRNKQ